MSDNKTTRRRRRRIRELPSAVSPWSFGTYRSAMSPDIVEDALTYRGLAMIRQWSGSPKGRRPPAWSIIHIGSGHNVIVWQAHDPYKLATLLAEVGDWEFDGLDGYKNRDPELPEKASALIATFSGVIRFGGGSQNQEGAMAVAIANG